MYASVLTRRDLAERAGKQEQEGTHASFGRRREHDDKTLLAHLKQVAVGELDFGGGLDERTVDLDAVRTRHFERCLAAVRASGWSGQPEEQEGEKGEEGRRTERLSGVAWSEQWKREMSL